MAYDILTILAYSQWNNSSCILYTLQNFPLLTVCKQQWPKHQQMSVLN